MPLYKYFISQRPSDLAPEDGKLFFHEAASTSVAAVELIRLKRLPPNWQSMWIHFLVWTDEKTGARGFESMPLGGFSNWDA